jgi:putative transposase
MTDQALVRALANPLESMVLGSPATVGLESDDSHRAAIHQRWWKNLRVGVGRAVDRDGDTIDFLLRAKRDRAAARAFFERAIDLRGVPGKITIDKSGSDSAAIVSIQADRGLCIEMRQSKYLDNIVEQDHRAVKRITRPILGLKSFRCARILLAVIEVMHMIRKGRLSAIQDPASSAASQFYSLAF